MKATLRSPNAFGRRVQVQKSTRAKAHKRRFPRDKITKLLIGTRKKGNKFL